MPPQNRRWRFHGLKKPKIRADWNKYTFYNLAQMRVPNMRNRTYFQQKWTAKATTRAYHGEQVKEKKWQRMFSRVTPAVVPTSPAYLAEHDGSEHASGRGSGRERQMPAQMPKRTPYMQMVFHPLERRLDTAIFRSLFASSARQARQLVVHGHVKVNGKKMVYPGYLLNPGDMFQVAPERVLNSTGKIISQLSIEKAASSKKMNTSEQQSASAANVDNETDAPAEENSALEEVEEEEELDEDAEEESLDNISSEDPLAQTKKALLQLRSRAADILKSPPKGIKLSARQKQDLRALRKTLKSRTSRAGDVTESELEQLTQDLETLSARITSAGAEETPTASEADVKHDEANPGPSSPPPPGSVDGGASGIEQKGVTSKFAGFAWKPKDYMSAFAFIPRYLEVNQNICSAVYLRHPVCKPGFAEVPTPFHPDTSQLAFNWYLRRR